MNDMGLIKLIVLSDTHYNSTNIEKLLPIINESNYVVHLGDVNNDIWAIRERIKVPIVCARGNCDTVSKAPIDIVLPVGNCKFLITHGHTYGVKQSLYRLSLKAESLGCDYVLYGHTHVAGITPVGNITMINPGALAFSGNNMPSYAVVVGYGDRFYAKIVLL